MKKIKNILVFIGLTIGFVFCSDSKNYKTAYGFIENGQAYIKIKGQRALMAHDPSSIGKTYEDSILILVPFLTDGVVYGKNIPSKSGNYKYLGILTINKNHLKVELSYDNTDDKRIDPISWNGEYYLKK